MEQVQTRYFDALYEAAKAINTSLNADEVLARIVRAATEAAGAKACSLMLLDEEKKRLVHTATYGLSSQYLQKGAIMADRSLAEALKGRPVVVSDAASDPRLQYPEEAVKEGIGSMLCVPVSLRDVVIGVIRTYCAQKKDFSADEIKLLTAIANLSAIAIQNARMHDSLKRAYETCQQELWHWQP